LGKKREIASSLKLLGVPSEEQRLKVAVNMRSQLIRSTGKLLKKGEGLGGKRSLTYREKKKRKRGRRTAKNGD